MRALLAQAKAYGCDLVEFPELALTTFFPRWYFERQEDIDAFFERSMPGPGTQPLFDAARTPGIGFYRGYAELAQEQGPTRRFNSSILVDKCGAIISKYCKIPSARPCRTRTLAALPASAEALVRGRQPGCPVVRAAFNDRGPGRYGMAICNDRRWPETYRVMGLPGVEMILLGYNTPVHNPPAPEHDALSHFRNELVMRSGAYQNGTWVVGVAKAGSEEGVEQIGNSIIVAPSGESVAACTTTGDELAIGRCDLDLRNSYQNATFNFARHRKPQQCRLSVERKGAVPPAQ